jgi:nitrogen regulatory protein P-II 1
MPQRLCGMKKIEAIIKTFRMEEVREALIEIGVEGVTVSEVKMLGRRDDHTSIARGGEYFSDFLPKLKFEIVVADNRVRRTVQAIVRKARTGRINDGRVFVVPIQQAIRIRTGERGEGGGLKYGSLKFPPFRLRLFRLGFFGTRLTVSRTLLAKCVTDRREEYFIIERLGQESECTAV